MNRTGANLDVAALTDARLSGAYLSGANLTGADLRGVVHDENTRVENVITSDGTQGTWAKPTPPTSSPTRSPPC